MYWLNIHVEHKRVNGRGQSRLKVVDIPLNLRCVSCMICGVLIFFFLFFFSLGICTRRGECSI